MKSLKQILVESEKNKTAIGHFNISDLAGLKAIFESARSLNLPVIIGVSEGERDFVGVKTATALIKSLREEFDYPIFLNADHTHSFEKIKQAVEAGFDAVLFDGGKLPIEENIKATKEVVEYVRSKNPNILIEGELGYIGTSSMLLKEIPKGAAIEEKDLTKPEEALRFVKETGIDMLAPAVGNFHGMVSGASKTTLSKERIKLIKEAVKIPLVLHGGSGTPDSGFLDAIDAGIGIVHINTEIRVGWRRGIDNALKNNPEEVVPYKILGGALDEIKSIVYNRLKLFNRIK